MESTPRTKNFSPEETKLLLHLIKKNAHILECKKSHKVSSYTKDKAWKNIERIFNEKSGLLIYRTHKTLRTKYCNLKAEIKKREFIGKRFVNGASDSQTAKQEIEEFELLNEIFQAEKQIEGSSSSCDFFSNTREHDLSETVCSKTEATDVDSVDFEWPQEPSEFSDNHENSQLDATPRTKNFSPEETKILLQLVKENLRIVESKKIDKASLAEKDKAWESIAKNFNASTSVLAHRTPKNLRTKYLNLKAELKKRDASIRCPIDSVNDSHNLNEEFDEQLRDILAAKRIRSSSSSCNGSDIESKVTSKINKEHMFEEVYDKIGATTNDFESMDNEDVDIEEPEDNPEHSVAYTNGQFYLPKSKKFCPDQSSRQTYWKKLEDVKAKWMEIRMRTVVENLKDEHKLRTAHMMELHKLQMQQIIEKHELEMRALRAKIEKK